MAGERIDGIEGVRKVVESAPPDALRERSACARLVRQPAFSATSRGADPPPRRAPVRPFRLRLRSSA